MEYSKRKYLLNSHVKRFMKDLNLKSEKSVSFYTVVKLCKEIKYSKIKSNYYMSTKEGISNLTKAEKTSISKDVYERAKKDKIGDKIKKHCYKLFNNNDNYYIEKYRGKLNKLDTLTLVSNDSKKDKILTDLLSKAIVKEVTHDERYFDKNLALFGNPQKNSYNIHEILKEIEYGRIKDGNKVIFGEMKIGDAVRIVLFRIFIDMKNDYKLIIDTNGKKGLKRLNYSLKCSLVILSEYRYIFDSFTVEKVLKHIKIIHQSLKGEKNIQFIKNQLLKISSIIDKKELNILQINLEKQQESEKRKILNFISTREFAIVIRQYELLLKENSKTSYIDKAQVPVSKSIKKSIFRAYKKSINLYHTYKECEDDIGLKKINKQFQKINILLYHFDTVMEYKDKKSIQDSINKIIMILNKNKSIKRKKQIAQTYLENIEKKPPSYKKIQKDITIESKELLVNGRKNLNIEIEKLQNQKSLFII
jgi:CYTH domain-containing protein